VNEQPATAEAGQQITHGEHDQQRAQSIEGETEKGANRRPSDAQQSVRQADADKA
jgi:hypothetical protein